MKFSLIMPVYNVEDYIGQCLDSILSQSFQDFECLLVDDGSVDRSSVICKSYSERDIRFKYFYKENGGLSDARNYGLKNASGDYVVFIDSDDVISPELLQEVCKAITRGATDIVYYDHHKFYSESQQENTLPKLVDSSTSSFEMIDQRVLAQKPNFAWARVARRALYDNNPFPVGFIYEDVLTSPMLTNQAKLIGYIKMPLYGYRKRVGSITTGSAERQFLLFDTVELLDTMQARGNVSFVFYSTAFVNLIQSCLVSLARIDDKGLRKKYRGLIKQKYSKLSCKDILSSFSLPKFKVLCLLSKNNFTLLLLECLLRPIILVSDKRNR